MKKKSVLALGKLIKSFGFAFNGIWLMVKNEQNARIHVFAAIVVVCAGFYFDISVYEWIAISIISGCVLSAEAVNSAIESLADIVSPGYNEKIKVVKDIAASAVLIIAIIAIIVGLLIFLPKIFPIV